MMLRQRLVIAVATPNLIPMPPARAPLDRSTCRAGQRVDDVEVWHREQLGFPLFQPLPRRRALALRAMPVAAANGKRPLPALWANFVMGSWRAPPSQSKIVFANSTHHYETPLSSRQPPAIAAETYIHRSKASWVTRSLGILGSAPSVISARSTAASIEPLMRPSCSYSESLRLPPPPYSR